MVWEQTEAFRFKVNSNNDLPSNRLRYCFGSALVDKGQRRVPEPPERITLIIISVKIKDSVSKNHELPNETYSKAILICLNFQFYNK